MNFLMALPGGVAITTVVMMLIHYGSIMTVGV